jgi:hypothetical protein
MTENVWRWERPVKGEVLAGGDLGALLDGDAPDVKGHFIADEPSSGATLLAREAIQNSWDAALELSNSTGEDAEMKMIFEFAALEGTEKKTALDLLSLDELKQQLAGMDERPEKAPETEDFKFLQNSEHLKVLRVIESGTTGMFGPWTWEPGEEGEPGFKKDDPSKMMLALLSVGVPIHDKHAARGGAFGLGKAGLISASKTKTIIAYSCFREHPTEEGITRRLYGMTYWPFFRINGRSYKGFAHFGSENIENVTTPFENKAADTAAKSLGLPIRDGSNPKDWGTSFFIIEPSVNPWDLNQAIERSWWPAQEQHQNNFLIKTIDYDGTEINMEPTVNQPELIPYIRAYEILRKAEREDLKENVERFNRGPRIDLKSVKGGITEAGRIALVADPEGWSSPDATHILEHRSLVALIREPRMVTQYFDVGPGSVNQVRGAFLVESSFDRLIGKTEPPLHDDWIEKPAEEGVKGEAKKLAKSIKQFVKNQSSAFRSDLRPPRLETDDYHLPELARLVNSMFVKGRPKPTRPAPIVRIEPATVEDDFKTAGSTIYMTGGCTFSLNHDELAKKPGLLKNGELPVRIIIKCGIFEDGSSLKKESWVPLQITSSLPPGFKKASSSTEYELIFDGPLIDPLEIEVKSNPYDQDFTGAFEYKARSQPEEGN